MDESDQDEKDVSEAFDPVVLKRALKAYKKRLKLTRLDAESTSGHGPFSSGSVSVISGVRPPDHYPQEVWDKLVEQGKLSSVGHGLYELGEKHLPQ
ncbi:MAG: hypothetical protein IH946_01115 [Bacteroidetes bacterium]|nr:hypothetical protein [Bacteroidota bacterium]